MALRCCWWGTGVQEFYVVNSQSNVELVMVSAFSSEEPNLGLESYYGPLPSAPRSLGHRPMSWPWIWLWKKLQILHILPFKEDNFQFSIQTGPGGSASLLSWFGTWAAKIPYWNNNDTDQGLLQMRDAGRRGTESCLVPITTTQLMARTRGPRRRHWRRPSVYATGEPWAIRQAQNSLSVGAVLASCRNVHSQHPFTSKSLIEGLEYTVVKSGRSLVTFGAVFPLPRVALPWLSI